MNLGLRNENGICILTPHGMLLGGAETDELESKILELNDSGNERLLVNLGKTSFMSTPGVTVFFKAHAKYAKRNAQIKLCCLGDRVRQVFVLVKLSLIYGDDQHETEAEALASFRQPRSLIDLAPTTS